MKITNKKRVRDMLHNRRFQKIAPIGVAVLVGAIGVYLLTSTNAATPTATIDPDSGTVTSPAVKVSDSSATGGVAVQFKQPASTPPPSTPTDSGEVLLDSNFETATVGSPMALGDYNAAMGYAAAGTGNLVYTSVLSESGKGKFMRQGLPANMVGGGAGIVTFPKLKKTVEEATIEYNIRFAGNFDWSLGGKLPGLGGATDGRPGVASGCNDGVSTAWSGRGMWNKYNQWIGYMYNKYKTNDCGDNISTGKAFTANKWHTIKQYYKMNTVNSSGTGGNPDGVHKMWFDGVQVVNNTSMRYRDNTNLKINYIFWSIFRGGSEMTWASNQIHYIDFDNILVRTP